jgi:hypothetical protein
MANSGWKTANIGINTAWGDKVDLGAQYKSLAIFIPELGSTTLGIQTAMTADGVYQNLDVISTNDADDDQILCSAGAGEKNLTVPFFGWQYLRFGFGTTQKYPRTLYCCGFD